MFREAAFAAALQRLESTVTARTEQAQTLVIIGNGMTCWKLCQKMVEHGAHEELRMVIFGEEPQPAYDRVHLTELFSPGKTADDLLLATEEWYQDHGFELYLDDPVERIDRPRSRVIARSGIEVEYNRLVFATGSHPWVPRIEGIELELPGVFVYRTLEDLYQIEEYSRGATRAAVIGGGLLGLEAAKAIHDLGVGVHVIEHGAGLMHRQIDVRGAEILKEAVEKLGIRVQVQRDLTKIAPALEASTESESVLGGDFRLALSFAEGDDLVVDMVVISAGIRPRGELAQAAKLVCAPNGGIVVDDRLETSDPQIYAIGECATHRGKNYGLVVPGYQMAEVLVSNLLGGDATFEGADMSAKLKLMGITVAALGEYDGDKKPLTSALRYTTGGVYRKLVTRNGRLIGVVTVGDWENLDRIRETLRAPLPMSFWDMRRFRSTGNLFPRSESQKVSDWAETSMVCGCLAVNRGTLTQAQLKGCTSVADLTRQTGAGSMCGSCKPLLADLLGVDENLGLPMPISMPLGQIAVRDRVPASRRDRAPISSRGDEPPRSRRGGSPRSVRGLAMMASGGLTSPLGPRSSRTSFLGLPLGSELEIADELDLGDRRSSIPPVGRTSSIPPADHSASIPPADHSASIPAVGRISSIPPTSRSDRFEGPESESSGRQSRTSVRPHPPALDHDLISPESQRHAAPEMEARAHPMPDEDGYKFEDGEDDEPDRDSYSEGRRSWIPPTRLSAPPAQRVSVAPPAPKAVVPPERGVRVLLVASFAAALLSVMTLAWPSAQAARSVHEISPLEPLWTDSTWKQVSGYALVGLCVVSLLFSARKRIPWFTFSDVPIWRMVHGVLGALTLTMLALHTGLHLGSHLILVLTLNFLAVILLGSVAGAITFLSTGWGPVTARNRRLSSARVHLLVCWPLPILIVLHVLQTYFY